jgi:preprotein translocase subunit SecY
MSALEVLEPIFRFIPEVKSPVHREDFNEKLKWTGLVLVLYFILTQIPLYGLAPNAIDSFAQLRAVMAGSFGSILTLGIGPIVTASIVLQLLVGSNLLELDLSSHKDKSHFQATQKVLSIVFTVFEASVLVLTGNLLPIDGSYTLLLIAQLVIGALVIIYLDEVVSKWGFGSGIGLFIAAGVCQAIIVGTFNFFPKSDGTLPGIIP